MSASKAIFTARTYIVMWTHFVVQVIGTYGLDTFYVPSFSNLLCGYILCSMF